MSCHVCIKSSCRELVALAATHDVAAAIRRDVELAGHPHRALLRVEDELVGVHDHLVPRNGPVARCLGV